MKLLCFKDWYDKYWEEPTDEEGDTFDLMTEDEQNKCIEEEYEAYVSGYDDYAYEEYKDRRMEDEY